MPPQPTTALAADRPAAPDAPPPRPEASAEPTQGSGGDWGLPFPAILLGLAVVAFFGGVAVVADWELVPREVRLIVFLAGFGAAYGGAWLCLRPGSPVPEPGHALVLVAVGLFGPVLLATAQMFGAVARLSDAFALWAAVAWLAAWAVPSRLPLWFALVLALGWSFLETTAFENPLPVAFLVAWVACAGLALWRGWVAEVRVAAGVLAVWYGLAGLGLAVNTPWPASAVAALLVLPPAALWGLASAAEARLLPGARTARRGAFLTLLGALVALALAVPVGLVPPAAWATPAALALGAVAVGLAAQAQVCGLSRDMALIALAAALAGLRPWLPTLPELVGLAPVPGWVVPAAVLALLGGFVAWALGRRQGFEALSAALAAAVLVIGLMTGWGVRP